MPGLVADKIGVELEARLAKLRADMAQAERIVDQSVTKMDRRSAVTPMANLSRVEARLAKWRANMEAANSRHSTHLVPRGLHHLFGITVLLHSMETLEGVVESTIHGIRAGFKAATGDVRGFWEEIEKGSESVKNIRLIGGALHHIGEQIGDAFTLAQQSITNRQKTGKWSWGVDFTETTKEQLAIEESIAKQRASMEGKLLAAERELEILRAANDYEKARVKYKHEIEDAERAIRDLEAKSPNVFSAERIEKLRGVLIQLAQRRLDIAASSGKGKAFDEFSTPLGQVKFRATAMGSSAQPAKEETAKQSVQEQKRTNQILQQMLYRWIGFSAFG